MRHADRHRAKAHHTAGFSVKLHGLGLPAEEPGNLFADPNLLRRLGNARRRVEPVKLLCHGRLTSGFDHSGCTELHAGCVLYAFRFHGSIKSDLQNSIKNYR